MDKKEKSTDRVLSDQWIMEQMQALMDLYARQKNRTRICTVFCTVFTVLSVLLSLLAIVIR